ncbi:MAG: phenylalanine--tRNA ligase subunit alpha [Planctomycetes bacterium]|nr:phenylalanine--tRNA ligase subunit alpha [Planctomycetota bacterium]
MSFQEVLESVKENALRELGAVKDSAALDSFNTKYLGRKGILRDLTGRIPQLSNEEKGQAGRLINEFKNLLTQKIAETEPSLKSVPQASGDLPDFTLPGEDKNIGRQHPVYRTLADICGIFSRMGFEIAYGPEIEDEYHNFTALNIPLNHPSRDAFDTFYLNVKTDDPSAKHGKWLLRSHTSPVQIRVMQNRKPPIKVLVPGKVFRPDKPSPKHFPMFHQVEGLMVGEGIAFTHLKGILDVFCKEAFGAATEMRFRPSFFPFTEPSAEVDITCIICSGKKVNEKNEPCPTCHGEGWIEILGSGMVHPNVLENVGYDSEKYTGFAFGMGVERIAMLKYHINDIRLFTENHIGFLSQF